MLPDDPAELIESKDYGSEGTAQRYLCALLINGPAYGYHKTWPLSERGARFVARLYRHSFGALPTDAPIFWNEMNLRAVDADDDHAVDYAFLWPDIQFLVELKTLGGSHRPGQLAEYLRRARHHNPEQAIDLLYLTQPMVAATPDDMPERCRYAHTDWPEAMAIAEDVWGDSEDPREKRCVTLLRDHLAAEGALAELGASSRSTKRAGATIADDLPESWRRVLDGAVLAAAAAAGGRRTAVEVPLNLVAEELFESRLAAVKTLLEAKIAASSDLEGVKVWWWRSSTKGRAYTEAGAQAGMELRLSPPA